MAKKSLCKGLLLAVLIFYIFTIIIKWIFRRKVRKFEEQLEQFGQNNQNETQRGNETPKNPRIDPNIGEYTDFEEVE